MRRFKYSIWDLFEELTNDKEKWNYYVDIDIQNTAQDLFDNTNALSFIKTTVKSHNTGQIIHFLPIYWELY